MSNSPIASLFGEPEDSYYKFMGFGPHTRLSLFMLFKHKALFFAHKNVLNDPTDCTPYLNNDLNDEEAADHIRAMLAKNHNLSAYMKSSAEAALEAFNRSISSSTSDQKGLLGSGILGTLSSPKDFITAYMKERFADARIFSMSKTWNEPRMWSHYASSHTGFCLELTGFTNRPTGMLLDRVDYTTRRPTVLATEVCALAVKEGRDLEHQVYNRSYLQKSVGWQYEQEYRLILPAQKLKNEISILSLPEGAYVHLPNLQIKSITLGLNSSKQDQRLIQDSYFQFLEDEPHPVIWKIVQPADSFDIERVSWEDPRNSDRLYIAWTEALTDFTKSGAPKKSAKNSRK
ncbi:DUF2971 domain-containing protein [Microvirga sp. Mcv34]|uniref:DUF2971 domain-containing protein n=1 Tax=Microvirga sp. Mcv34 TaxID=2926016 RepID=UPI0021C97180|nr:DUF2971 domain-containing protein [Microvirga sp. Mcv34]